METFFKNLELALLRLDIREGSIVYVASDITSLMIEARKKYNIKTANEVNLFLNTFIDILQKVVGRTGTLLFPIYTWEFCRKGFYDIRNTNGEVGVLPNWVLENRSDFVRTKHPIYSFLVWGKDAEYLVSMDNIDGWGSDSPFNYLHDSNATQLLFNVSLQSGFTFMHYVERCINVPYRYNKLFIGKYVDKMGHESIKEYSMFVRDLDIESRELLNDTFVENLDSYRSVIFGKQILKTFKFTDAFSLVKDDFINNGGSSCYKFSNYVIDWSKGAIHDDEICNRIS